MRVGIGRIEGERVSIAGGGFFITIQIVIDVSEVEVRLEEIGFQPDRALVKGLRLDQLVGRVVNVRKVDERRATR